jgi:hypothetical protein
VLVLFLNLPDGHGINVMLEAQNSNFKGQRKGQNPKFKTGTPRWQYGFDIEALGFILDFDLLILSFAKVSVIA